jgi:hypothetical protein
MEQEGIRVKRLIHMHPYSDGLVSVPVEDVALDNGIPLLSFPFNDKFYVYHSHDPSDDKRIIYMDIKADFPKLITRAAK